MSSWARNGRGDICVCNGGGGEDMNFFFEMLLIFGLLARVVQIAKNYQLFEKSKGLACFGR